MTRSLYVQDTWTRNRLTLQGALRYDHASSFSPAERNGTTETSRFNGAPITFDADRRRERVQRHLAACRSWPTTCSATARRRSSSTSAATWRRRRTTRSTRRTTRRTASSIRQHRRRRSWTDTNGNYVVDCDILNPAAQTVPGGDVCGALTGNALNFGKAAELDDGESGAAGAGASARRLAVGRQPSAGADAARLARSRLQPPVVEQLHRHRQPRGRTVGLREVDDQRADRSAAARRRRLSRSTSTR